MAQIKLSRNEVALVDDTDFKKVSKYKWHYHSTGYARGYINGKPVRMHHFITGAVGNITHLDGDKLNNQMDNLFVPADEIRNQLQNFKTKKMLTITRVKYEHPKPDCNKIEPETIIEETAKYFSVTSQDILGTCRKRPIIWARQIAQALVAANCRYLPLTSIGRIFGGRDHATIIHSMEVVRDILTLKHDDPVKRAYEDITDSLPFDCSNVKLRSTYFES